MNVAIMALVVIVVFLVGFWVLGVLPTALRALATAQAAREVIRDSDIDDLDKEQAVKKIAFSLFGSFMSIFLRSLVVLLMAILPIWLADLAGFVRKVEVFEFLERWDVIIGASLLIVLGYLIIMRVKQDQ